MIAALTLMLLSGAPTPDKDPSAMTLRLRPLLGLAGDNRPSGAAWLDLGAQVELSCLALRYEHSIPIWWATRDAFSMAPGQCLPTHDGFRNALSLGYLATLSHGWLGAGAGWNWATLDTLAYRFDGRETRIHMADGSFESEPYSDDYSDGWVWKERLHESAPFLYLEAGLGGHLFSWGYRAAFSDQGFRLGTSLQLAFTLL